MLKNSSWWEVMFIRYTYLCTKGFQIHVSSNVPKRWASITMAVTCSIKKILYHDTRTATLIAHHHTYIMCSRVISPSRQRHLNTNTTNEVAAAICTAMLMCNMCTREHHSDLLSTGYLFFLFFSCLFNFFRSFEEANLLPTIGSEVWMNTTFDSHSTNQDFIMGYSSQSPTRFDTTFKKNV